MNLYIKLQKYNLHALKQIYPPFVKFMKSEDNIIQINKM